MRVDRLKVLADHLEKNVKEELFDMHKFFGLTRCGTTACALGHACFIPQFNEEGLTAGKGLTTDKGLTTGTCPNRHSRLYPEYHCKKIGVHEGFDAGQKFFGLTREQTDYLFDPFCYGKFETDEEGGGAHIPISYVVQRIREMIRKHESEQEVSQ